LTNESSQSESVSDACFLVDALLAQQQLTAVEQFAHWHERSQCEHALPLHAEKYLGLIPATLPNEDQQFAFEVDLDACSGCKACVTACHNLNGLEEGELWRQVGLLQGGTSELPLLQHVTAACHHCLEPACLTGCPANAYEKDALTGIVRHLDDQCIGCQYCLWMCPYDVPRYSKSKGIVRKCDMCHERLAAHEAPACVQACPNRAIRIRLVDRQAIVEAGETGQFLPGAPEPRITLPTTVYKTRRAFPRNVLPADYFSARRQHNHWPLVLMLVFTQMSVGAFVVEQSLRHIAWRGEGSWAAIRPWHLAAALLLGLLGLGAAVFHLGRPRLAYRAVLGWRRSWLSREIIAFGLFAAAATTYAVSAWDAADRTLSQTWHDALGVLAAACGVAGVACSVMIYVATRRPFWSPAATMARFLLTAAVLGIPAALLISFLAAAFAADITVHGVMLDYGRTAFLVLLLATAAKLLVEAIVLFHLRDRYHTPLKRTALLLTGELSATTYQRYFCAGIGGIVLPLLIVSERALTSQAGFQGAVMGCLAVGSLVLLTIGELLERSLFFMASSAPKMPGAPAS
jgi:formate dehydrogenase iron-sulfur subunit